MSQLLEILGRAMTIEPADLILNSLKHTEYPNCSDSPRSQQINDIIDLMVNKKNRPAEKKLTPYLLENPDNPKGRLAAAVLNFRKNQIPKAVEQLKSVYRHQPGNTVVLYLLGFCCELLGREAEAIEFYQDCLKFKNYLPLPRMRLAAVHFKNCQLEKTIAEYEMLKQQRPDDIFTLVKLGFLYIAGKDYETAAENFNTAILIHPDNFTDDDSLNHLIRSGCYQPALEHIDNLLGESAQRPDLIIKKADIFALLDDPEQSIRYYQLALRICPDFLEPTIKLGTQLLKISQPQLAAEQFNRAVEINDQVVDAYIGLSIALESDGNTHDALATLSLAAAIQPNSSVLFTQAATLQFEANLAESWQSPPANLTEVIINAHQQQLINQPRNPDLLYRTGILLTSAGKVDEATGLFKAALDINPTFSRAASKLAVCLFQEGQKKQALKLLCKTQRLDKNMLQLHYKTALLYCNKVKFASSLINLERYLKDNFTCDEATINLAIVLQNLGLLDRCCYMWDNVEETARQAANLP